MSSFGSLLKRKDMAKREMTPDQRSSEDGEAVFIQRLSPERGSGRGKEMWITVCVFQYVVRGEWSVIQSSPASRHWQATKKPILPRQKSGKGPLGGQKRIRDSPFKLFGRRSEAGVLMDEQLLIVRVRLRDRSSSERTGRTGWNELC